jgi:hypothetical protein
MSEPTFLEIKRFLFHFFKTHESKFTVFNGKKDWPPNTIDENVQEQKQGLPGSLYIKVNEILPGEEVKWEGNDIDLFFVFASRKQQFRPIQKAAVAFNYQGNDICTVEFDSLDDLNRILVKLFKITSDTPSYSTDTVPSISDAPASQQGDWTHPKATRNEIITEILKMLKRIVDNGSSDQVLLGLVKDFVQNIENTLHIKFNPE